ncbi:30S ribosomal protein S4 [Mycoplasma sp. SG1]|uniref:30S ribosomal protein S4 n=1 Tax=Mycoplasma sp. SG1 TaxID=2810348 RepID=UPI002024A2B0
MRYTGPVNRIARRLKFSILDNNKEFSKNKKRTTYPGMHPNKKRKQNSYALQLIERQKIKYLYGLTEKNLKNLFEKAAQTKGSTTENMMNRLESRLDNVVYRLGWAPTRKAARQLVLHNHILVNNEKVNIPSFTLKINDVVSIKENSKKLEVIQQSIKETSSHLPFVTLNEDKMSGFLNRMPERKELNMNINESLVVEYYSY